jgi:hypothetical protein
MENTFNELATSRLADIADRVAYLHEQGDTATALLLNSEARELVEALDGDEDFLYINDTARIQAKLQGQFGN